MNNKTKIIAGACAIVGIVAVVVAILLSGSKTYTVSFDTDGGSFISMQEIKKGEKISKPTNPAKEGYSFVRWEYQNKEYDFTSTVENDMTLKAIWDKEQETKYKITFNVDGKTHIVDANMFPGDAVELPFEEKDGYELVWYLNGTKYDFNTPVTTDIILEGKYEKTTNYTVKFNSNGGTSVKNQTVKSGEKVSEPSNVTKEGYILDGWYLNNNKYDFNSEVTKNITLVAKWSEDPNVKRYTVTFNSDGGGNISSQKIIENKTATQPKNPTKSGYAFEGWYLNNSKYDFKSKVTKNITLVAKWRELAKYTVSFNSDGGSSVTSQTIVEGGKATKPSNPTKDGQVFKEWLLNGSAYNFSNVVKSDITLVASWKVAEKYTVSFNSNGGSDVSSVTVSEGSKVTKPANPTWLAHTFVKWTLNGSEYDFNKPVTGNITLVASWSENKKYKIEVEKVDNFSTDVKLTVKDGNNVINYESINFTDGTKICSKSPCIVTATNIKNESQLLVKVNGNYHYASIQ